VNYELDWATVLGPKQSKADRRRTLSQTDVAEGNLVSQVTNEYVELLRQGEAVRIDRTAA